MSAVLAILAAIVVLGPLIALHEWGHYIVARLCGVKVLTYSIGFGPKIMGWTSKRSGIDYRLSALPLGGYVKLLDEREGEVKDSEKHLAMNNQHPLKKIAIAAAGPVMNFIIAILLYWLLFMMPSEQLNTRIGTVLPDTPAATAQLQEGDQITAIDGHQVNSWEAINYRLADKMGESTQISVQVTPYVGDTPQAQPQQYQLTISNFMQGDDHGKDTLSSIGVTPWQPVIAPIIGEITADGAAMRQGLQAGDRIIAIDDNPIDNWVTATRIIREHPETTLNFTIERDAARLDIPVMPQGKKDTMGNVYGQIGARAQATDIVVPGGYKTSIHYEPVPALGQAFAKTQQLTVMTLTSMGKMLSGIIGLDNLSGPITIAKVAKQSFEISWEMVLSTAAIISLSLAVLNLLPIPVLDGGHIVYYAIELIRGKPLSEQTQIIGFNVGLILLVGFMLLAIGNDLSRLF